MGEVCRALGKVASSAEEGYGDGFEGEGGGGAGEVEAIWR